MLLREAVRCSLALLLLCDVIQFIRSWLGVKDNSWDFPLDTRMQQSRKRLARILFCCCIKKIIRRCCCCCCCCCCITWRTIQLVKKMKPERRSATAAASGSDWFHHSLQQLSHNWQKLNLKQLGSTLMTNPRRRSATGNNNKQRTNKRGDRTGAKCSSWIVPPYQPLPTQYQLIRSFKCYLNIQF